MTPVSAAAPRLIRARGVQRRGLTGASTTWITAIDKHAVFDDLRQKVVSARAAVR